ncbi:MAG: VCBS repeat-containing protein [Nannocystaceae bacterium]|nr:VCBS repeat-containing protein [Myxococcales bacterium]
MDLRTYGVAACVAAGIGLVACGGDDGVDTTAGPGVSSTSSTGLTTTTTDGTDPTTASSTDGTDTGTDSDTGVCPAARDCGDVCCEVGELCVDGACQVDCGGPDPCGADQVCCGAGELCYVGQCVTPGGPCSSAVCATKIESDCDEGQLCDPELSLCVPNFADPTCAFDPEPGVFDPIPRFTWGSRKMRPCTDGCQKEEICQNDLCVPTWNHIQVAMDDEPDYYQCVMSPMVADVDGDCVPEIIFNTYKNSGYTTDGILRVIRGDTGAKVFTLADPEYRTDPGSHPAIGDLDGDGTPEIIVPGEGSYLIAVNADGSPRWKSDTYGFGGKSGSPSLANFDGQGAAEIAFGRAIFDVNGALVWEAPNGATGANGGVGPLSCVADLTGDGRPELIAGGTAHTFTGTVGVDFAAMTLWTGSPADGYCGVADFDLDGAPEVALVNSANIYIFNGQTGATLASVGIPGGGAGGAPNIADFDGDGIPDIGTAGGDRYVVARYEGPGVMTILWTADTKDGSSQRTGSSVFDFDGDGRSEVIYGDEWYLRIYPGTEPDCANMGPLCDGQMTDEEILFIDINSSRTRSEFPVVADVDGDFKAEIIVSTNNESNQGAIGDAGVEVFEDRLDNWVGTLPIWNQHTYHVTNALADASIPQVEPPNWSVPVGDPYNSYRRNTQGELASNCAPDLVPADLTADTVDCQDLEMSVKVVNQGCLGVGPGVNVAFYDAEVGLLGVVKTQSAIPAGGSETVSLMAAGPGSPPFEIFVVVDDDGSGNGAFNECLEDNNESVPVDACMIEG